MIKGILFDKDGTLIDFYKLWLGAAKWAVPRMLKENEIPESLENYILETIGVRNGQVDPAGALAYKTYSEIAEEICTALNKKKIREESQRIKEQLERLFHEYAQSEEAVYEETSDLHRLMRALKARKIKIGMATADTYASAEICLKKLHIMEFFDYIGADDGKMMPKPETDLFRGFEKKYQLAPSEIMVVGDTYNDMLFAKRCGGISVAVLCGVSSKKEFENNADYILKSVGDIPVLLDEIEVTE